MRELILNEEIHPRVIGELVPSARKFLWIVTADIKDMHVVRGKRAVPFLKVLAERVEEGVAVRLIHAKEPGPRFRADFDKHPVLVESDLRVAPGTIPRPFLPASSSVTSRTRAAIATARGS